MPATLARVTPVDELLSEAQVVFAISVVAIAKQIHKDTGKLSGEFQCPRCHVGTVKWAVAESNGHASVLCSTRYPGADGKPFSCTSARE